MFRGSSADSRQREPVFNARPSTGDRALFSRRSALLCTSPQEFARCEPGRGGPPLSAPGKVGTAARYALGAIRVVNGALGLVMPAVIIRRLGGAAPPGGAAALLWPRPVRVGAD